MESKTEKSHNKTAKTIIGKISISSKGMGYVTHDDFEEDIMIEQSFLNTALHGDEVEIIYHKKGDEMYGEVVKVIKRVKEQFVGTLEQENGTFFLVPDDRRMYMDILIPKDKTMNAQVGEKALSVITGWSDPKKNPEGKIIKVIGKKGDNDVEMESIVLEKGFATDFPDDVLREAEALEKTEKPIPQTEIANRRDVRDTLTFTIDPADAKDFDDAISIKELARDQYEIGVHIADVSYYVREGTALDREAIKRSCSVYLVDRTIPMLPHVLSNDMCSLNPNEDKLTFSSIFIIAKKGKHWEVEDRWFGRTVINSDKRFTYEEAQEVLNGKSELYATELKTLNEIAKDFREEKFKQGAIDFEQSEVKFELDAKGKPIRVFKKERLDTHKLVEEFMLLANKEVATYIFKGPNKRSIEMPFVYRIHDTPNPEKIASLGIFVKALGYDLPIKNNKVSSKDLQILLSKIEGKAEESLIKTATVRSMAKAIYSTQNIGHFGLGFSFYTHFTSPIRRYPDLLVHRLLEAYIKKHALPTGLLEKLEQLSGHATEQEIAASEAERTSIKMKQVEFMQDKIGQTFEGVISGVTEWGIYVEEKETRCEGMVKLRDLNDFFVLDEKNYALVGEKTKKKYTLGDTVKIKVAGADVERKTLDYQIVE